MLSTQLDRVRTVDLTASLIHRMLGLVTVRIGTGSTKDEDKLVLDGLSEPSADRLRAALLHASSSAETGAGADADPDVPAEQPARVVLRLNPAWVRFAPLTTSGLVIAGAALGFAAQAMRTFAIPVSVNTDEFAGTSIALLVTLVLLIVLVVLCLLAVVGYLVTNFGFELSHTRRDGSWHLRRGLFTTRLTSLDDARVSGVSIGEPIGLRLAGGARLSAIVTGLGKKQQGSSVLVPPAPRAEVDRVAVEVLGKAAPVTGRLRAHGPRAVRRRWTRALVPAAALALAVVALAYAESPWLALLAPVVLAVGAVLALDRSRGLGHDLVDGCLVARSGSLARRREALSTPSVIGWNLRSTWFQRRAGLTDLVATTAGGRQSVRVLDLSPEEAVALAREAQPGLLEQFLEVGPEVSSARTVGTGR